MILKSGIRPLTKKVVSNWRMILSLITLWNYTSRRSTQSIYFVSPCVCCNIQKYIFELSSADFYLTLTCFFQVDVVVLEWLFLGWSMRESMFGVLPGLDHCELTFNFQFTYRWKKTNKKLCIIFALACSVFGHFLFCIFSIMSQNEFSLQC